MLTSPLVSCAIGVGLMGDVLTPQIVAGAAICIGGVAVVAITERLRTRNRPPPAEVAIETAGSASYAAGTSPAAWITAQATRAPAPPIGWLVWSSGSAWMTRAEPSASSRAGRPPSPCNDTRVEKAWAWPTPSDPTHRLGRSPQSGL